MKQFLIRPFLVVAILVMTVGLSACETMEGLGRDLQKVGGAIEKKAEKPDSTDE